MEKEYVPELEWADEEVSQEQVQRLCNRYYWAGEYCRGKDTAELACGTGQSAGYLSRLAKSYVAGDISREVLELARGHYGERINFIEADAHELPFGDHSKDVVILFEAVYYLKDIDKFLQECKRVLRPGGKLLIVTANKDLYDFHPSKYAVKYYGVVELRELLTKHGFQAEFFGDTPFSGVSLKQRILRPVKKAVVSLNLLPKSNAGKRLLKKFVFGGLIRMPREITAGTAVVIPPVRLSPDGRDTEHKVIFCAAEAG
ncbi:MAG: methyltransferase domain-containing protein [Victivallaceae bacterium]|nr:methyltransferase domain-containing protein [Victivallaceae bacterium]